jgi:hypothetical protein
MLSDRQALDVFENKIGGSELGNDPDEIADEGISRIV